MIQVEEVVVMVDLGATHNFISTKAIQKLNLPVSATKSLEVMLGTGEEVQGQGGVNLLFCICKV